MSANTQIYIKAFKTVDFKIAWEMEHFEEFSRGLAEDEIIATSKVHLLAQVEEWIDTAEPNSQPRPPTPEVAEDEEEKPALEDISD